MVSHVTIRTDSFEKEFELKEEVGRGQFAVVHRVVRRSDGLEFAAKFMKKRRNTSSKLGLDREEIVYEAEILSRLDHPHVIPLLECFENRYCMILIFELLRGGELFAQLCHRQYLPEGEVVFYLRQVLAGLQYLHQQNVVHLDIKPENIVLNDSTCSSLKIIDFGLSKILRPGIAVRDMVGTPEFVAPEVINYDNITFMTDMWSIGVLAFILATGQSPFQGENPQETYERVITVCYNKDHLNEVSPECRDFITTCLQRSPKLRLNVSDALDHPWIRGDMEYIRGISNFNKNFANIMGTSRCGDIKDSCNDLLNTEAVMLTNCTSSSVTMGSSSSDVMQTSATTHQEQTLPAESGSSENPPPCSELNFVPTTLFAEAAPPPAPQEPQPQSNPMPTVIEVPEPVPQPEPSRPKLKVNSALVRKLSPKKGITPSGIKAEHAEKTAETPRQAADSPGAAKQSWQQRLAATKLKKQRSSEAAAQEAGAEALNNTAAASRTAPLASLDCSNRSLNTSLLQPTEPITENADGTREGKNGRKSPNTREQEDESGKFPPAKKTTPSKHFFKSETRSDENTPASSIQQQPQQPPSEQPPQQQQQQQQHQQPQHGETASSANGRAKPNSAVFTWLRSRFAK